MKNIRKCSSILLAIVLTLSLLPAISFAQELAVSSETSEEAGPSVPGATVSQETFASHAPSNDQITPLPAIADIARETASPQKSSAPKLPEGDPIAPVEEPASKKPENAALFSVDGFSAAPMSILTGDGYSYDPATQTLTVEDASKTKWKTDGNLMDWQTQITTVNLPDSTTLDAARTRAEQMFDGCTSLKTVNNLEFAAGFAGGNPFSYCTNLTSVTLPSAGCELP